MIEQSFQFLRENNEGILATVADDKPQTRAFQVMHIDGTTLYFATSPRKSVYNQLQANPNVEFVVLHDKVSVRCAGRAYFDVPEATQRQIFDDNPVLPRLYSSYEQLVYFRLPVERLEYYDLRPTPPIAEHYDLVDGTISEGFRGERFSEQTAVN